MIQRRSIYAVVLGVLMLQTGPFPRDSWWDSPSKILLQLLNFGIMPMRRVLELSIVASAVVVLCIRCTC